MTNPVTDPFWNGPPGSFAQWNSPLASDRVALVTGGAGAIARSICIALAEHGADVVVADIDEERTAEVVAQVQQRGRRALGIVLDLTADGAMEEAVARSNEFFGRIDILVNALVITWDWLHLSQLRLKKGGMRFTKSISSTSFAPRMP
jgi:NAD(P)-dependent dehydrogenase (short-subunit alcohol dehydrogenase family)